jgi:transposase-like protein
MEAVVLLMTKKTRRRFFDEFKAEAVSLAFTTPMEIEMAAAA